MKKKIILVTQLIISICFLVLMFYLMDTSEIKELLLNTSVENVFFIFLAFLISLFSSYILALRWRAFLSAVDRAKVKTFELFSIIMVSRFFKFFLPGQFTSDVYRVYILAGRLKNAGSAFGSTVLDRFIGLFMLSLISFLTVIFVNDTLPDNIMLLVFSTFAFMVFSVIMMYVNTKLKMIERVFYRFKPIRKKIYKLLIFLRFALFDFKRLLKVGVLSLLYQIFSIIMVYLTFLAFTDDISIIHILLVNPIITILLIVPLSINGFGQREALSVFFYSLFGIKNEVILLSALTLSVISTLISLIGGLFYIAKKASSIKKLKN